MKELAMVRTGRRFENVRSETCEGACTGAEDFAGCSCCWAAWAGRTLIRTLPARVKVQTVPRLTAFFVQDMVHSHIQLDAIRPSVLEALFHVNREQVPLPVIATAQDADSPTAARACPKFDG